MPVRRDRSIQLLEALEPWSAGVFGSGPLSEVVSDSLADVMPSAEFKKRYPYHRLPT